MERQSLFSPRSSAIGTVGWSCLSRFSLADVSEISVINLPISAKELWNGQRCSRTSLVAKGILEDIREVDCRCGILVQSQSRMGSMSRIGSIFPMLISNRLKGGNKPSKAVRKLLSGDESPTREAARTPSISFGIPVATLPRKVVLLGTSPFNYLYTRFFH